MKKVIFGLSFVVISLFANDFDDSISKIDTKNPASFAESAFDINKKVGVALKNSKIACEKFDNLLKNELSGKTQEQKDEFLKAYKKAYDDKIASLSAEEKAEFKRNACGKFHNFDKDKFKKMDRKSHCNGKMNEKKCEKMKFKMDKKVDEKSKTEQNHNHQH